MFNATRIDDQMVKETHTKIAFFSMIYEKRLNKQHKLFSPPLSMGFNYSKRDKVQFANSLNIIIKLLHVGKCVEKGRPENRRSRTDNG